MSFSPLLNNYNNKMNRQQLNKCYQQNQHLRQEMVDLQLQIKQLHQSQNNLMIINRQLKEKNSHITQSLDEWKRRASILKDELAQGKMAKQEINLLKEQILELKRKNKELQQEKKKLIEISLEQKMNAQQRLTKISMNKLSSDRYYLQIETELCKSKQTIYKLQAQIKKLQIHNDEVAFNKQWSKQQFQKQHFQRTIKELQGQVNNLRNKNRKEKEKKVQLQRRNLQLQERTGLLNVKAQAYEEQVFLLQKKIGKMSRGVSQAKLTSNKMTNEKMNWEDKFNKSVQICQELISRVKRQLFGDAVQLARTCEYRLGKLKENKDSGKIEQNKSIRGKNVSKNVKKNIQPRVKNQNEANFQKLVNQPINKILSQTNSNNTKQSSMKSKQTFNSTKTITHNQLGQDNLQNDLASLQAKVRRQRQQMQKKLKEKMLFRQLQISNSPQKSKLRQDYLKLVFQR